MGYKNIDNIVRNALKDNELPFDSQHWQQFEGMLNGIDLTNEDAGEDSSFDNILASNLAAIESKKPADWAVFEGMLDRAEEEDPLDAIIAAGLTGAVAVDAAPDWNAFNDILTTAEANDLEADGNTVDETVKQNLENYEAPYEPENWEIMRERIAEEFSIRRRLIRYKAAEISLMLLAIFTLFNFLPKNELGNFKIIEKVEKLIKKNRKSDDKTTTAASTSPIASTVNSNSEVSNLLEFEVLPTETRTNYIAVANPVYVTAPSLINISPLSKSEQSVKQNKKGLKLNPSSPILVEEEKKGLFSWMNRDNKEKSKKIEKENNLIDKKSFSILTHLGRKKTKEVKSSKAEKALKPSKVKIEHKAVRLGMFTSADLFGVYSPYDRFFNYRPDAVYSSNFGGGIMIDFQKDRTHIQVGGAYMPKYFTPDLGDEIYGSFFTAYVSEEFKGIQLDVLHIPFEVRYDFVQKSKWRIYGAAGMAANLILNTTYQIDEDVSVYARATPSEVEMEQDEKSNLANKDFTSGAAEGGNLGENLFLSVQLGFGAERFVSQRWSIFLEPIYQQQFSANGIGPNENSFRTLSIRLGAKATMFGK